MKLLAVIRRSDAAALFDVVHFLKKNCWVEATSEAESACKKNVSVNARMKETKAQDPKRCGGGGFRVARPGFSSNHRNSILRDRIESRHCLRIGLECPLRENQIRELY
jgi:hypothetical protein